MIFFWPHVRKCGFVIRNSAQGIRNLLTVGISRPRSTDKTDNSNPLDLFLYNFALDNSNFFISLEGSNYRESTVPGILNP